MSTGLLALLDDVAAIAKVAAASLDDVAAQTVKAGTKSVGVVIDDAAVTPRYVVGFAAERELPIVGRIALGSVKNKLLFLLPAALGLSLFAPGLITPLLMLGGGFLCYEGAEKILEVVFPNKAHRHEEETGQSAGDPMALEENRVKSAIRTDFILSAEIMAITLSAIPDTGFWTQAAVLALVGVGITGLVYGAVAIIVKADDVGLALSQVERQGPGATLVRALGRGLVRGMPWFLRTLAVVGTVAMLWVGGSIFLHGLEVLGWHGPADLIHHLAAGSSGFTAWLVSAAGSAVFGILLGALIIPLVQFLLVPAWRAVRGGRRTA